MFLLDNSLSKGFILRMCQLSSRKMFRIRSESHVKIHVKVLRTFPKVSMKDTFVALLYITMFLRWINPSAAKNPEGFLSIDCGNTVGEYVDPQTNLTWVDDTLYTKAGKNGKLASAILSHVENYKALNTFRYFPFGLDEPVYWGSPKYCYEIPTSNDDTSFLIRAMFLHGNSPILEQTLFFTVYVNSTLWINVQYGYGDDDDFNLTEPVVREGMFSNQGGRTVNVCLVQFDGTPFISSLELRKLDSKGSMYAGCFVDNNRLGYGDFFLSNLMRWNVGLRNSSLVRYPKDRYDRFWEPTDDLSNILVESSTSLDSPSPTRISSRMPLRAFNSLPVEVMEDAWSVEGNINFTVKNLPVLTSGDLACLTFYVYLNESRLDSPMPLKLTIGDKTREFNIRAPITIETVPYTVNKNLTSLGFQSPAGSRLELMALEIDRQDQVRNLRLNDRDEKAIQFLKKTFNRSDWHGDPCYPTPYPGIYCFSGSDPSDPNILQIYELKFFNLENSRSFVVPPDSSAAFDLPLQLDYLTIKNSSLDDHTVQYLLNNFTNSSLLSQLDLSHNSIGDFLNPALWRSNSTNPFNNLGFLDLSYNHLTNVPSGEDLKALFSDQSYLYNLDISNNNITGEVSGSLLQYLLNSTVSYMFADNNTISGHLDLTSWYQVLLTMSQNSTIYGTEPIFNQLFSFTNNDILDIIPSVESFQSIINIEHLSTYFEKNGAGIVLGGNPYCRHIKTKFQSFLCRSSGSSAYSGVASKQKFPILPVVGGVLGGNLVLIGVLLIFAIIWRLRKQVVVLREFQQELLNRNVKPPFFSYQELKTATNEFHGDNKLGSGAFGAVYKGILQNKTEVAVKKLFNSYQQAQVLNDFLNEVVLLTGIKHKNLVQLLGCCINDNQRILVYEFAERGNVADALWGTSAKLERPPISWARRLKICLGVARGLAYLHEELQPRIIHRDIKAANILIDANYNSKIADFGLAIPFQEEATRAQFSLLAGTKGYLAPEYAMQGLLTEKADVYSFGILVLEIICGKPCLDPNRPPDEMSLKYFAEISQKQGNVLDLLQPELREECVQKEVIRVIEIALLCVDNVPKRRPRMSQVVTMLAGITEDALFLSLSTDKESFDDRDSYSAAQSKSQGDSFIELALYNSWLEEPSGVGKTLKPSRVGKNAVDYIEEEALIPLGRLESSFSVTSYDEDASSSSGTMMTSFRKSMSGKSLGRH